MTRELPQTRIDAWDLLKSVRANDRSHIETLLQPLGDTAAQARYFLLEGVDLHARFLGVQLLANSLRDQGDMITNEEIARALFRALEHDPRFVHGQQAERHMVNNVFDLLVFALSHSGRYRELILEYPRWLAVAERTEIDPYFPSRLRLALTEALVHAGEYERAIGMLEEACSRGIESGQVIEAERLRRMLQNFYGPHRRGPARVTNGGRRTATNARYPRCAYRCARRRTVSEDAGGASFRSGSSRDHRG